MYNYKLMHFDTSVSTHTEAVKYSNFFLAPLLLAEANDEADCTVVRLSIVHCVTSDESS